MRPYLAVIKDSFREALASRVLWILLLLITLFLLALAPLSVPEEAGAMLQPSDLHEVGGFALALVEKGAAEEPSPEKHVWDRLSEDLRELLQELDDDSPPFALLGARSMLSDELNEMLKEEEFYDEQVWAPIALGTEPRNLLEQDSLSEEQLARRNRLLLDAAFREYITGVSPTAVRISYFGYKFGSPIPVNREMVQQTVKVVLAELMKYLAGVIGVLIAILVTASIIPQMFEAGAIDLLLSKPVSRSLLFLTKFFGGCAFIFLNVTYFITGLWLLVGLRFDIWSGNLLLCIPVFLFLFAIYYSVSSLAGVIWKNAVVSVVFTILFWAACFSIGLARNLVETTMLNPTRHAVVAQAGDTLIAARKTGDTFRWDSAAGDWEPIFEGASAGPMTFGLFYPMIGPYYDARNDRLMAVSVQSFGLQQIGSIGTLVAGSREGGWVQEEITRTPPGAEVLIVDARAGVLMAGTGGIYRLESAETDQAEDEAEFVNVGGPETGEIWKSPFHAALQPQTGDLFVYQGGTLLKLHPTEAGRYEVADSVDLQTNEPALVGAAGEYVVVALGSGEIRLAGGLQFDGAETFTPFGDNKPRSVHTSPDGRWTAVVTHQRELWLYDLQQKQELGSQIKGQGDISAVAFTPDNRLLVSDRFGRVSEYTLAPFEWKRQMAAPAGNLEKVYRYALNPLYTIFPKPGELDYLVSYLLTDQETQAVSGREDNLRAERAVLDIWTPVWSNLAFLGVMLTLTCLYIARHDF